MAHLTIFCISVNKKQKQDGMSEQNGVGSFLQFQVLQHRMVDMFIEHEQTKSLAFMAAMKLAEGYNDASRKALSALKVQVGKGGTMVGQQAVQLHGGDGVRSGETVEKLYREIRALRIYEGASDVQRVIIARQTIGQ